MNVLISTYFKQEQLAVEADVRQVLVRTVALVTTPSARQLIAASARANITELNAKVSFVN